MPWVFLILMQNFAFQHFQRTYCRLLVHPGCNVVQISTSSDLKLTQLALLLSRRHTSGSNNLPLPDIWLAIKLKNVCSWFCPRSYTRQIAQIGLPSGLNPDPDMS